MRVVNPWQLRERERGGRGGFRRSPECKEQIGTAEIHGEPLRCRRLFRDIEREKD